MRTLKLTIAYDGTRYAGWQVQEAASGKEGKRTIQGTLEKTLERILQQPVRVVGSGRTDAGVHALAQVAHLRTRSAIPCERLLRSLNQLLPQDIAISAVEEARPSFHARFQVRRKRYRYRLFLGAVASPFIRPYVHCVAMPLDVARMRRELAAVRGWHDFRAFARDRKNGASTVRRLSAARLLRRGDELQLELEGSGFLHTMVRSIAGTLLDVGRGRLPPGTLRRLLKSAQRSGVGATAPAKGLTLVSVDYDKPYGAS